MFIANDMESSGEPSAVHISEYTRMALDKNGDGDQFVLKEFKPDEEKSSKLSRKPCQYNSQQGAGKKKNFWSEKVFFKFFL